MLKGRTRLLFSPVGAASIGFFGTVCRRVPLEKSTVPAYTLIFGRAPLKIKRAGRRFFLPPDFFANGSFFHPHAPFYPAAPSQTGTPFLSGSAASRRKPDSPPRAVSLTEHSAGASRFSRRIPYLIKLNEISRFRSSHPSSDSAKAGGSSFILSPQTPMMDFVRPPRRRAKPESKGTTNPPAASGAAPEEGGPGLEYPQAFRMRR